jgi:hypothetical protein
MERSSTLMAIIEYEAVAQAMWDRHLAWGSCWIGS